MRLVSIIEISLFAASAATHPLYGIHRSSNNLINGTQPTSISTPITRRHTGPMSLHEHIANGIAKFRSQRSNAQLLEVFSRAREPNRWWDESDDEDFYNPLRFSIFLIAFRAPDPHDPGRMVLQYINSEGLGHWDDQIRSGSIMRVTANVPFDWEDIKHGYTLAQAVGDLGVINPRLETDVRHFRILARPDSGYDCEGQWCLSSRLLSESIPRGIYYEFAMWDIRFIRVVYINVASGDIYVDPKPGDSGSFHREANPWPAPPTRSIDDRV